MHDTGSSNESKLRVTESKSESDCLPHSFNPFPTLVPFNSTRLTSSSGPYCTRTSAQTYLSTSDFFSSAVRKSCYRGALLRSRSYLAILKALAPWPLRRRLRRDREPRPGRLGSRSVRTAQHGTSYHRDPRASHRRHRRPSFKRIKVRRRSRFGRAGSAPAAELRTIQMHSCIPRVPAPCVHRVLSNLAAASRPRLPSARRSVDV